MGCRETVGLPTLNVYSYLPSFYSDVVFVVVEGDFVVDSDEADAVLLAEHVFDFVSIFLVEEVFVVFVEEGYVFAVLFAVDLDGEFEFFVEDIEF